MRRAGRRRGFALLSALAVVLLFAFVTAILYYLVLEGDRRIVRLKGERAALDLAENAIALQERRFTTDGTIGPLPPLALDQGVTSGETTRLDETTFRIRGEGVAHLPGGGSVRTVVIVEGHGDPYSLSWSRTSWRFATVAERLE